MRDYARVLLLGGVVFANGSLADDQRARDSKRTLPGDRTQIDLNRADEKTLAAVPVIGAELARTIVAARPFESVDQLNRITGLSAERLEQIRLRVKVSPPASPATRDSLGLPTRAAVAESTKSAETDSFSLPTGKSGHASRNKGVPQLDVNNASEPALAAVAEIGPELARTIVAARPFATLDELSRLRGLSAERLEQIKLRLSVTPRADTTPARR